MKIKISDMFDSVQDIALDIQEEKVPVDRVRKKVLEKIQQETMEDRRRRRIRKPVLIAVILAAALGTRRLKLRDPGKPQLCLEMAVEFLNGFTKNNMGAHGPDFAPYLGTISLYILLCNIIGIFGLVPPTKDLNVTAALAIMSAVLIYGAQFRYHGLRGGLKKFMEPMPLLLPINLMEVIIRPLSLCMRLFGNVLGAFIIMELIKLAIPAILPMALSMYFDVFDGIIQTIVFVFLTALFTAETIE